MSRGRLPARRPHWRAQDGFTIVEMVTGSLMVVLLVGAMVIALVGSERVSADQRHRSQADALAQQDQERLRGFSAQQLVDTDGQQRTQMVDGTTYTITTNTQFLSSTGNSSCSSTGNQAAAYYRTSSSVNWPGNLRPPVVEESLIAPPAGGTVLVLVEDQTGAAVSGVGVTASGPDTETASTSSGGCTVLAGLSSGSYALALSRSGYVDPNGYLSPPGLATTVTSTGTATPSSGNPVKLALAGNVSVSFSATGSSGAVAGEADTFSWSGTGSSEQMATPRSYTPVASSPASRLPASGQQSLYPFAFTGPSYTNNYQVWAGKCQQMQPPAGTDMFSVAPGSSQALTVQEPALDLLVSYNGTRVKPDHVKLSYASSSGASCSVSWYPSIASDAATNANGALAAPGQPYVPSGLTICADYGSQMATMSGQSNANFSAPTTVSLPITSGSSSSGTC